MRARLSAAVSVFKITIQERRRMAVISVNDVFSHVFIGAADSSVSAAVYDAALGALGIKNLGPFGNGWVLYGRDKPAFILPRPGNGEAPSSNGATIRFAAASQAEVDAFHAGGVPNGGTDHGVPGPAHTPPGANSPLLRAPARNKIPPHNITARIT